MWGYDLTERQGIEINKRGPSSESCETTLESAWSRYECPSSHLTRQLLNVECKPPTLILLILFSKKVIRSSIAREEFRWGEVSKNIVKPASDSSHC